MENEISTSTLPISVIIPTYCEEKWLPILLESISKQVLGPLEVIVADAQSTDKTREIAVSYGAQVVEGGRIAVGRNAGAKIAKGKYLLFMDADTELPSETAIFDAFVEFVRSELDIASAHYIVSSERESSTLGKVAGRLFWGASNVFRSVQSKFQKVIFEGGAFVFVKESVYKHLGGFNERLNLNEDPDFYKRAVKLGYRYGHLPVDIVTSSRRFDTPEKLGRLMKYFVINTFLIGLGYYAGSQLVKKNWKNYGNLGGGKGKDPMDES